MLGRQRSTRFRGLGSRFFKKDPSVSSSYSQAHLSPLSIPGISKAIFHNTFTLIERSQLPSRKTWANNLDKHFTQGEVQMARKHGKMLSSSSYRETQTKTAMCCDCTLSKTAQIKPLKIPRVGETGEQPEFSDTAGGSANWYKHFGELFGNFF